ncbi:alpha/beta hydrolase-fold protein [Aquimarina agarilytica]|uniref:alpha/beta hydrolase-fold protein n=1 Tax=Aquimarina agarilytica TaxID=1087449 RepID=UPI0012FA574C|nr:alpha/beta hydrolase-fold protein [Aquimarina agarilytica]
MEKFHLWTFLTALWGMCMTYFQKIKFTYIDGILILYFGYLIARFCVAVDLPVYKSSRFIELVAYGVLYIQIKGFLCNLNYTKNISRVIYVIIGACFFEAILAILQYFDLFASSNKFLKLTGTLSSPNFLGVLFSLGSGCIIWLLYIKKERRKKKRILLFFLLGVFLVLILLSNSRTSWLVILTSFLLFFFESEKLKEFKKNNTKAKQNFLIFIIFILTIPFLFLLYNYKKDSADGRLLIAKITTSEIYKKPFLGHGLLSFERDYNLVKTSYFNSSPKPWKDIKIGNYVFNPYNDYLFYLFEIGLLGGAFIVLFIFSIFFYHKKTSVSFLGIIILSILFISAFFMPVTKKSVFISIGFVAINLLEFSKVRYLAKYSIKNYISTAFNSKKSLFIKFFIIGISSSLLFFLSLNIIQSKKIKKFYDLSKKDKVKVSTLDLTNLFKSEPYRNGYSQFFYGLYLYDKDPKKAINIMEKAYAQNNSPRLAQRLAHKYLENGNLKRASELYKSNIGNEPYRFEPKKNLQVIYGLVFDQSKKDSIANLIIDFPVKIPSKKVDEYKQYSRNTLKRSQFNKYHYSDSEFNLKGNLSYPQLIDSKEYCRKMKFRLYFPDISLINKRLQVVYLADGQQYVKDKRFVETVDKLIHEGKIAPLILVFLDSSGYDNPSIDYRQDYYFCNRAYVNYLTHELIPYLEKYYPVSKERNGRSIMGYSFGGLFAAFAGMEAPDYFKNVIMQSPAYHPCPDIYTNYNTKETLDLNMYLSYGTGKDTESQDIPMIQILQAKGYDLKVNREEGANHEWHVWMNQTKDIFKHYFKID